MALSGDHGLGTGRVGLRAYAEKETIVAKNAEAILVFHEGRWWYDHSWDTWKYRPSGLYNPAIEQPPSITIDGRETRQLITALDEAGWIQPRLDERLREGDIKITHRLLDIIYVLVSPLGDQSPQVVIKTPAEVIGAEK